jgi:hypothetical protein
MRVLVWIMAVAVLASCATQSDQVADALEVKARAGDPVAACQLVVHDLRECTGIWGRWRGSSASTRPPSCLDNPVPEDHERYLAQSVGWTEGAPALTPGSLAARNTRVLEILMKLNPWDYASVDDVAEAVDAIGRTCPGLADDA